MKPLTAIAVSGGIDSLMAAYLLKEKGHDVIGIHFVTGYEDPFSDNGQSPHLRESHKNFPIATQLGIDIKVLDCRIEFKKNVVDYFIQTYQTGQIPNPCMVCNPTIKFKTVFDTKVHSSTSGQPLGSFGDVNVLRLRDDGFRGPFKQIS